MQSELRSRESGPVTTLSMWLYQLRLKRVRLSLAEKPWQHVGHQADAFHDQAVPGQFRQEAEQCRTFRVIVARILEIKRPTGREKAMQYPVRNLIVSTRFSLSNPSQLSCIEV